MAASRYETQVRAILECAGIEIDGPSPWDVQVRDSRFFKRVLAEGSIGLGESYMDGWWECERLDEFFHRVLRSRLDRRVRREGLAVWLKARLFNPQKVSRAFQVGRHHYDIGNDLYERMLGPTMVYSCGYWRRADTLEEAQEAKMDLVCRKLDLQPGMRVLDIGCGWGAMARFAAERYGVEVVGVTVSRNQAQWAEEHCRGLPVTIRLQDYRSLDGRFDRILSLGMFEHVGYKNYRTFMQVVRRTLRRDGLFLLHTIGSRISVRSVDPWIARHIFPNSMLPSARQIAEAAEPDWLIEDWHNFGADYDRTLMAWHANFERHWPALAPVYGERFRRMWRYYLLSCAGSFRARKNQLWQIVFSPEGVTGGYRRLS